MPDKSVMAVFCPPAKEPLAPLPGAAKETVTPCTGRPPVSVTVTTNGFEKAVLMVALCGDPLATATEDVDGAVILPSACQSELRVLLRAAG